MKYTIKHETKYSVRLHLDQKNLSTEQMMALKYKLLENENVTEIKFFKSLGGINISFKKGKDDILSLIKDLDFDTLVKDHHEECLEYSNLGPLSSKEISARKLDPRLKKRLQNKIVAEAISDFFLPTPVQLAMHLYEFATIEKV